MALFQSHKRVYGLHQSREMTNAAFLEKFTMDISVIEQYDGSIGCNRGAIKDKLVAAGVALLGTTIEKQEASTKDNE
jgi:hypothetical protein